MIMPTYTTEVYKLYLASTTTKHVIDVKKIVRIQSISNYSKLFFRDGRTLVVAKILGWFEQQLQSRDFVRVHRTHLVNTDYICQYRADKGGSKLELTNGEQIDVSRRKAGFLKLLKEQFVIEKMVVPQAC
jgi:two-component system LytT family response regulator